MVALILFSSIIIATTSQAGSSKQHEAPASSLSGANFRFRFTVGSMLAIIAAASTLFIFGESWVGLFAFGLAVIYVFSEILTSKLPRTLRRELQKNCVRLDGSWSSRRERKELGAVNKLRWDIRSILLMAFVPSAMLLWVVDKEVIPLSIGFDSLIVVGSKNVELTRSDLSSQEQNFDKWKRQSSGFNSEDHKRMLFRYWPACVFLAVLWFAACWKMISHVYIGQLKTLAKGISERRWEYKLTDRARSSEWSD